MENQNQNIEKRGDTEKYIKILEKTVAIAGIVASVGAVIIKTLKNRN